MSNAEHLNSERENKFYLEIAMVLIPRYPDDNIKDKIADTEQITTTTEIEDVIMRAYHNSLARSYSP